MPAMTNAPLLILFALLGSGTAIGDKQANIPVRQLNNGTLKNSASYVMSVQYSHGNSSAPHLTPERPAQNSVVGSSNSVTQLETSTARPAVPNKVIPVRKATNLVTAADMGSPARKAPNSGAVPKVEVYPTHKTANSVAVANVPVSPARKAPNPGAIPKVEISPTRKAPNPVAVPKVELSPTRKTANLVAVANAQVSTANKAASPVAVETKPIVAQVQESALYKSPSQQAIVTEVTYPDSFISAQIAAASLTTPSPDTYAKPVMLQQQTAPSSYSSWQLQPHQTTIDRSYSIINPLKPDALQQTPVQSSSTWHLQPQTHSDISYAVVNPAYTKLDMLQHPATASSTSGWQLQQTDTPIDRSYSAVNSAYASPFVQQPTAALHTNWHPQQLQTPIDRVYSSVNSLRYYPYNTLRQSASVEPYIDKRNQKYKHYSLSRQPSQHLHGSYPVHVHSHPYSSYYNRRPPIERENPPFFKPYPTKYVHFPPNRFPTPYNGMLNFSPHRPSYKDSPFSSGSSGSLYYKILFPLALLGISIPAIGMMYTYLSKRRRRRSADDPYPSTEDIEYYMQVLQKAVEMYQQNVSSQKKYS